MEEVYIVQGHVDYNSSTILSVHLDEESAQRKVEELKKNSRYDWIDVSTHSVRY